FVRIQIHGSPHFREDGQVSDRQISRICNYLRCLAPRVKKTSSAERSIHPWTIRGAPGLQPTGMSQKGECRIPKKMMREQGDEAVSLTPPRDIIRVVRCNRYLTFVK